MGLDKKGEGIKQRKKLKDTDSSMVISMGKREWREVEEGKGGINSDERKFDMGW